MLGRWPGALRTVRQLHTGALRATMPRAEETVKEINKLQRTYHPLGYENSAGYLRARKPYVVSNMLIFLGLMGFVGGVYTYSIVMDDFSDLDNIRVLPEGEAASPDRLSEVSGTPSVTAKANALAESSVSAPPAPAPPAPAPVAQPRPVAAAPVMNKKAI